MPEVLLRIEGLSKTYRNHDGRTVRALEDISLTVDQGEVFGVAGESGAGKSSLARLILGLERPCSGAVYFEGFDLARLDRRKRREFKKKIQMVWQDPTVYLNPGFTAAELISEPLEVFNWGDRRAIKGRVAELLALVDLESALLNRRPHELSGGQCQRIAIARAAALNPSLMICDEILASLDLPTQVRIIELLKTLNRELGLAVIFIAHDLAALGRLCGRLAVMRQGRIVEVGPVRTVFGRPAQEYTRRLLAAALTFRPHGADNFGDRRTDCAPDGVTV
ncbi:MAG: dipeptide/oligopeptide/nickel ABC transporter ATP-binding protein [Thermodesulfobacteriota bacterium]